MMLMLSRRAIVLLSCVVMGCAAEGNDTRQRDAQARANPDALVLQDFNERIDQYLKVHNKAKREVPALKETKDPAKIQATREGLAEKIRAARPDAKPGDIFTPDVRRAFRKLMYPELKGREGAETKESLKEDAPKGVLLKVNAKYPEAAPLPTMPPNLLAALPKLPETLEYRIIGRDLILLDVDADLIVDYIPAAIR